MIELGEKTIAAEIGGAIRLRNVPPKQTERIRRALSFPDPEYVSAQRMNRYADNLPERYHASVECPNADLLCPRGSWHVIKDALAKDGWTAKMACDERASGGRLALAWSPRDLGLRDYQHEGIEKLKHHLQGLIVLPCGVGKTRLGVGLFLALGLTTIIIAHTGDLMDQWVETLRGYGVDAGRIDKDHDERDRPVVVASIQMLRLILDDPLDDDAWLARFGLCILDEAHHAPAETFQRVLLSIPAKYRLGLTATPEREDGLTKLVEWSFGPTLLERDTREMIHLGFLMAAEIEFVETAFQFNYDGPEKKRIAEMDRQLVKDEARNAAIADLAAREGAAGECVLILANRKAYANHLAKMVRERGTAAKSVIGTTAKKQRRETIENLRGGDLPVMVATSLADEGLDVQRLSRVILAWPQRAKGGTTQRVGRLLRDFPGKKPKLYDFVDPLVPTLNDRAAARRTTYRKLGLLRKGE